MAWEQDSTQKEGLAALTGVLIIAFGWMVQGAAEEILTRGWLMPVISSRYNTVMGIFLSSGLFAMLHLLNPHVSPIAMLNIFLFGVFTCLYALYEGNLWGVFAIHSVWNWAQGNFYGFEVSGNPPTGVTLFNLMEVGPDEITGGPFGPEGGLAVTAILLLGCMLVLGMSQFKKSASN
jgi:membrane protease YdiL (CAAX protease family)